MYTTISRSRLKIFIPDIPFSAHIPCASTTTWHVWEFMCIMEKEDFTGSCIYQIENKINNHIYIGSSADFTSRYKRHRRDLRSGRHHSRYLQRAYDKYGEHNFKVSVVALVDDENDLIPMEQHFLDNFIPEYNMNPTAGSNLSRRWSAESRRRMSIAQTGRKHPQHVKDKISKAHKELKISVGRIASLETREKQSKAQKGRVHSNETRAKLSESLKGVGIKSVDQFTLNGEYLKTWESMTSVQDELGIHRGNVSRCCRGVVKRAGQFIWKFSRESA